MNNTGKPHVQLLTEFGIQAQLPDGLPIGGWGYAYLRRGGSEQDYTVFRRASLTLADAAWMRQERGPLLALGDFISPRTVEALRRADIQYLDTAGNAWIHFGDVLIDVRGRLKPKGLAPTPPTGNLFSTARAQVIFALLAWPRLWQAPLRELARAADVSVGQAHSAHKLLLEAGYSEGLQPDGQPDLLDLWAAAYPTGLGAKLTRATYSGNIEHPRPAAQHDSLYISGESAVPELRPATLTLYTHRDDPLLPVANRWRSDGPPNIEVRRAFWRAPDGNPPGVQNAPWPLVYADLAASDEPRVRQAAQDWRRSHAGPHTSS